MIKKIPTELGDSLEKFANSIRSRRTVKLFKNEEVSRDIIIKAIEVARWAPNHHLTEPWNFYILGKKSIKKSVDLIRIVTAEKKDLKIANFKADQAIQRPGWLVVTCNKSDEVIKQQEDYASVCCAIQNFFLYLSEAGLASKWSTGEITRDQRFYELLKIDTSKELIVALIWYGYPKVIPTQKRREVSQIVTYLK